MAMYEDFLPYVAPEVPGAAEVVVLQAIRNACIEFCEKSLVLVRDHDPVDIKAGVVDYDLDPPSGYVACKVMQAFVENNEIHPLVPDFVKEAAVYNRLFSSYQSQPATPQRYLQKDERSISLWPLPDKDYPDGLTMRVALKPTRSSTSIEDVIFEDYAETIAAGALARLHMSPGKTYTDANLSGANRLLFQQGINVARSRAVHGNTRSNLRVQLRKI